MTSPGVLFSSPGERLVALGSVAVRPVAYRGEDGSGKLAPSLDPIEGLVVRVAAARAPALLHAATNVYGFVDLVPGAHLVDVVDPRGRFLPCTIAVVAPDRRALGDAIRRRAAKLPDTDDPPLELAWLRPSAKAPPDAGFYGVVRGPLGEISPFAWIRIDTFVDSKLVGRYVTHADEHGEYVAPLPDVRKPADGDPPSVLHARVHRLGAATAADAGAIALSLVNFDALSPEVSGFDSVYEAAALIDGAVNFNAGTSMRLDLQPV